MPSRGRDLCEALEVADTEVVDVRRELGRRERLGREGHVSAVAPPITTTFSACTCALSTRYCLRSEPGGAGRRMPPRDDPAKSLGVFEDHARRFGELRRMAS